MILFAINLFIIFIFLLLLILSKKATKRWLKINDYIGLVSETINSAKYGDLEKKIKEIKSVNPESYEDITKNINQLIDALKVREEETTKQYMELMHQNRFLESVINSLSDGLVVIDEDYKILRVTSKIIQWFNIKDENILKQNLKNYIKISDKTSFVNLKNTNISIKTQPDDTFEATSIPLKLDDQKKRYIVVIKNITDVIELDKIKDDFVATLTHDLKVPIIAESNILEFLLDEKFGNISNKQKEALINMQASNNELIDLVQTLLETYKIKDSGVILYPEYFEINKFIESIITEMIPIADKAGIKIDFEGSEELTIYADNLQLKRAIKNIIQNAINHTETKKKVDIKIKKKKTKVYISIINYGKDISKEDIEMIFKKYYSTARKYRKIGTGLGLYLAQQVVKSHNGEITVENNENENVEFCIKLPISTKKSK